MPNYKEISFLENFGISPIESVEQEVSQADCPERAAFLQHYIEMYKETLSLPPPIPCRLFMCFGKKSPFFLFFAPIICTTQKNVVPLQSQWATGVPDGCQQSASGGGEEVPRMALRVLQATHRTSVLLRAFTTKTCFSTYVRSLPATMMRKDN